MWTTFFRDGGLVMFPTTVFGFFLVMSAALCVLRPARALAAVSGALALLTLSSGALGTAWGLINTFRYLPRVPAADRPFMIAALGVAESLNNLLLALLILCVAALLLSVAAVRNALREALSA
jgi:hypothetical protein